MKGKIIPFGYSIPDAHARLAELMQDERAILVDIRQSVKSEKKPEWAGEALQKLYKNRYLWIQALGNLNYFQHGAPISINNSVVGIPRLLSGLEKGYTIILLCTCKDYSSCHRKVVVEMVQQQMSDVEVVLPAQVETISCLSIQQPWSWLIVNGLKDIENRDWTIKYQGPLFIHAGKKVDPDFFLDDGSISPGFERKYGKALAAMMPQHKSAYVTGVLVGVVQMTGVVTKSESPWFRGPCGFVLEQAKPLLEPIPYRGAQNVFPVPYSVVANAKYGTAMKPPVFKEREVLTPKDEAIIRTARIEVRCTNLGIFVDELMVKLFNGMRSVGSLDQQEYARLNTALLKLELDESKKRKASKR